MGKSRGEPEDSQAEEGGSEKEEWLRLQVEGLLWGLWGLGWRTDGPASDSGAEAQRCQVAQVSGVPLLLSSM